MSARAEEIKSQWRARVTNPVNISPKHREPNGRHQRDGTEETEKQVLATALAQPHRRGIKPQPSKRDGARGPADVRAGYVFGRMQLQGELSKPQHDALAHWLEVHLRFVRAYNLPAVRYGSCLAVSVGGSGFDGDEMDPAKAAARAKGARVGYEALEAAMAEGMGREITAAQSALVHVVLMDREPWSGMIGVLRSVANVIDRHRSAVGGKGID